MVFDVSLEMQSDSKNYVSVQDDEITKLVHTLFFFIRTSNFDAEAERSYIFWRFEAETFLKMFLMTLMVSKSFWNNYE